MRLAHARRLAVRMTLGAAVVVAATACDSAGDDADADSAAWCAQLDVAATAIGQLDALGRDDPGVDDALATMQEEMATLAGLTPPPGVSEDWETVSGPPPTDETGAFDLGGERADAGARVATWALDNCELSSAARTALDEQR